MSHSLKESVSFLDPATPTPFKPLYPQTTPRHPDPTPVVFNKLYTNVHMFTLTLHTQKQIEMSKSQPLPKRGKLPIIISPTLSDNSKSPSFAHLEATVVGSPGVMRNSIDAHRYLEGKNYMLTQKGNTVTALTSVLLSLVVNTGPCSKGDRVPEGAANVIKAVALMEDAVTAAALDVSRKRLRGTTVPEQLIHLMRTWSKCFKTTQTSSKRSWPNTRRQLR